MGLASVRFWLTIKCPRLCRGIRYSSSGGDAYHGSIYADFQPHEWQATNIADDQIARGVSGGSDLDAREVNRLQLFRDFNADVGGYLTKGKAWWYSAYGATEVAQRYAWLLDTAPTRGRL